MQIRNLRRVTEGDHTFWVAEVHAGGVRFDADRRYGSWQATFGSKRRDVLPLVAEQLQKRVRKIERSERRAAEPEVALAEVA